MSTNEIESKVRELRQLQALIEEAARLKINRRIRKYGLRDDKKRK